MKITFTGREENGKLEITALYITQTIEGSQWDGPTVLLSHADVCNLKKLLVPMPLKDSE